MYCLAPRFFPYSSSLSLARPIILVGYSYGRHVSTYTGYNNPNVTGLVYVAAFAPDESQSLSNLIDLIKLPKDLLVFEYGGFSYINPFYVPWSLCSRCGSYRG
jgi:pimeloyl-ACP methyl ester carboxylesterase